MNSVSSSELTEKIVEKAKSLGAAIAGVASVESLKESPSHWIYPEIGMNLKVYRQEQSGDHAWVRPAHPFPGAFAGPESRSHRPA
jgi:hypothetical protein